MPNRQVAIRRRGNYGAYAAALARGARTAFQNRAAITEATKAVKRKFDEYRRPKKTARTTGSATTVGQEYGGGNDWSQSRRKVGYKKKPTVSRLARMLEVGMNKQIYRYQGITNFDTNAGYHKLWNTVETTGGGVNMPFHIYDLTTFPNIGNIAPGKRFAWSSQLATADVVTTALAGQTAGGTDQAPGNWVSENTEGSIANARVMRHDWSDIRINFYGPRNRTTKFEVMFVRIKDELSNPAIALGTNISYKELCNYLERPCIFSNLQSYQPNVSKKMRIVKKFTYWISAGQTTDVVTNVGKIKEARIFMRHDRIYNLDWRHETSNDLAHAEVDGIDFVQDTTHHNGPWYGSRLFMIVRAFAPQRRTIGDYNAAVDANIDPTYDILIRNCVSTPT